jgi:hypothetical protein
VCGAAIAKLAAKKAVVRSGIFVMVLSLFCVRFEDKALCTCGVAQSRIKIARLASLRMSRMREVSETYRLLCLTFW